MQVPIRQKQLGYRIGLKVALSHPKSKLFNLIKRNTDRGMVHE